MGSLARSLLLLPHTWKEGREVLGPVGELGVVGRCVQLVLLVVYGVLSGFGSFFVALYGEAS